ncbi:MAG: NAD(P)/FAD-dependent oxidoreductase, partial [Actinobacteria bacterium]|nr:NAD(P)/FAD-dependent oxidoreductase [Actinomycetota bacterium]
ASSVELVKSLGVPIIAPAEVTALKDSDGGSSGALASIELKHADGTTTVAKADACIAALGFVADLGPIANWGVQIEGRKVAVDRRMESNVPRVFAAGDMAAYDGKVALISVGFGEAATAVNNAVVYINPDAHVFPGHSSG